MEPLSLLLGGGSLLTSILNSGNQSAAQQQAHQDAISNLIFQQQQADKADKFSKAGRVDAYGNAQVYNPITNTWETKLSDTQRQITNAGEQEQLKSLTTDAQRNRALREQAYERAQGAAEPLNKALAGYQFDQPDSEGKIRNDLETLMIQANKEKNKGNQDILARQAMRLGRGGDIPKIIKATDDQLGSDLAQTMLNARSGALQERGTRVQQHEAEYGPEISKWLGIISGAGADAPARFSNVPQQLDAVQKSQADNMLAAIKNSGTGVGTAFRGLQLADGKSADLSGISTQLNNLAKLTKTDKTAATASGTDNASTTSDPFAATRSSSPFNFDALYNSNNDFLF